MPYHMEGIRAMIVSVEKDRTYQGFKIGNAFVHLMIKKQKDKRALHSISCNLSD